MAHVPLRIAQTGLIAPHQQQPTMMVSMPQPPVTMQGMASVIGPGGGMTVMNPTDAGHVDHSINGQYHPHHIHPQHTSPRHHAPLQNIHTNPNQSQYHASHSASNSYHSQNNRHNSINHYSQATPHNRSNITNMAHNANMNPNSTNSNFRHNYNKEFANLNSNSKNQTQNEKSIRNQNKNEQNGSASNNIPQIQSKNGNSSGKIADSETETDVKINKKEENAKVESINVSTGDTNTTAENSGKSTSDISNSANKRDKTPMSLVNELARHHKITHQYCLTGEEGPAHKRIFTVLLKIGSQNDEEQYSGSGASIKKAQHEAASIALEKTKFKKPPPKTYSKNKDAKLPPTVELNAIAMKRGQLTKYTFLETPRQMLGSYGYNHQQAYKNPYSPKFYNRPMYPMFIVSLRVGSKEFKGEGSMPQQAKHNAALKALKFIKSIPDQVSKNASQRNSPESGPPSSDSQTQSKVESPNKDETTELVANADLKSPVSLVYEIALKRNLTASFEILREQGPPHLRVFVTKCTVGDVSAQAEGAGKRASKKAAAQAMYEELKKLPVPPNSNSSTARVKQKTVMKKKVRNLVKDQESLPESGHNMNPITRLIQIQQAKKEKEPEYKVISERGAARRREFVIEVTVGDHSAQGMGRNKKQAKKLAAEEMLKLMGFSQPSQAIKPALKPSKASEGEKTRKVKFAEVRSESTRTSATGRLPASSSQTQPTHASSGRQLVPGLIVMQDGAGLHGYNQMQHCNVNSGSSQINLQTTAAIAKELLESGVASTTPGSVNRNSSNNASIVRPSSNHVESSIGIGGPFQAASRNGHHQQPSFGRNNLHDSHTQSQAETGADSNVVMAHNNFDGAENGLHATAPSRGSLTISGNTNGQAIRAKDQLMYLANILNLQVQFTDFPKGNKNEYLSLVSLSTTPPHVSHGSGPTLEASHDQACLTALRALAEMGLDSVNPGST